MSELVSEIRFIPIKQNGSHLGFVNFLYDGNILFKDIAVHVKRDEEGVRLVFPRNQKSLKEFVRPQNKKTQEAIDGAISKHLKENGYGK